jgi:hypothetical protein
MFKRHGKAFPPMIERESGQEEKSSMEYSEEAMRKINQFLKNM